MTTVILLWITELSRVPLPRNDVAPIKEKVAPLESYWLFTNNSMDCRTTKLQNYIPPDEPGEVWSRKRVMKKMHFFSWMVLYFSQKSRLAKVNKHQLTNVLESTSGVASTLQKSRVFRIISSPLHFFLAYCSNCSHFLS